MSNLELLIFSIIGLLSLDFLLTRDNLRIVKKFFLLNLSVSILLLFEKAYIAFFIATMLSMFVFGVCYILANEEHQKESAQDTWVDILTIVFILAMVGIVSVVFLKFPITTIDELTITDKDIISSLISNYKPILYMLLGSIFLIFSFLKSTEGQD